MAAEPRAVPDAVADEQIVAVRRFNRFYTRLVGALDEGHLRSPFSLAEVRVLYELAHREAPTATELARDLALDAGYLSRILSDFERRGLLTRRASATDGRQHLLSLTARGRKTFAPLDARTQAEVGTMLERVPEHERPRVVGAMRTIQRALDATPRAGATEVVLRPHRPGDMGWVTYRHGVLYHQEYGWDERFEALVARICAEFIERLVPERERCWIAERDGEILGSVFLVRKSDEVAKLRLLYVEPSARGLGVGTRLVDACVAFARAAGYRQITLWTQSNLYAARRIYERAGFRKVAEEPHHSFGHDLVAETWELELEQRSDAPRAHRRASR